MEYRDPPGPSPTSDCCPHPSKPCSTSDPSAKTGRLFLTTERMFAKLTQNCGRCRSDGGGELPPGRVAGGDRSLPPAAENESAGAGARRRAEGDPPCDGPPRARVFADRGRVQQD